MATETDLTGLGVAAQLAAKLGNQPSTLTAVGTTQGAASTLLSKNVTVNAATGATAVILNPNADIGTQFFVANPGTIGSAASALIFVPSGHSLYYNGAATVNAAYTLGTFSAVILFQTVNKAWYPLGGKN